MIFVVGDIHGCFGDMFDAIDKMVERTGEKPSIVIQVGDFGYWSPGIQHWKNKKDYPVYFIDGNHEDFKFLHAQAIEPLRQKNLHYISRGTVMELEGKVFAFCGGGESLDRASRKEGYSWFREERVTEGDIQRTIANVAGRKVDYLITHTPPISVIRMHFPAVQKREWGLPSDWTDESALRIHRLWESLDFPELICGHMHESKYGSKYRILAINEVAVI